MQMDPQLADYLRKCKQSVSFFINHNCKVLHPSAGVIPFKLFKYQINALKNFRENRFNIFKKCRQCAREDTPIWTPNGNIPIKDITPGSVTKAFDFTTGATILAKVEQVHNNGMGFCQEVRTASGHRSVFTSDHEFYTNRGWVEVGRLWPGDALLIPGKGYDQVTSVRPLGEFPVYDLTIPPYHNYLADGAVVHNCGISTLSGAYALWFCMFHPHKTVLVVSKRDEDAKVFLDRNVKLIYDNLPSWMRDMWPTTRNEHELGFANGSKIKSMTSSPDTLRSSASSLNIIDESAFMPDMDAMWAGGWSSLQHGGQCIVISTTNGSGGWYWAQWIDAKDGIGVFNPIEINWWDMDWVIEWTDDVSGRKCRLAPTDNLRKCNPDEIDKWGPYWSPWLEQEWRGLQLKGESFKFRQEILAEFIGSGSTILSAHALTSVIDSAKAAPKPATVTDIVEHENMATGERTQIDFRGDRGEGLYIWSDPVTGTPPILKHGRLVPAPNAVSAHRYVMGVDVSTGQNNDGHGIEIFDVDDLAQVGEYWGRVPLDNFSKMVDYLGRRYNNALICVERTGGLGESVIQDLLAMMYPNLWRKKTMTVSGERLGPYGFATSDVGKPALNKALLQYVGQDNGFAIMSERLSNQLQIYIRRRTKAGHDTKKTGATPGRGNFDDLVIACALAFMAAPDVDDTNADALSPVRVANLPTVVKPRTEPITKDPSLLAPMSSNLQRQTQMDVSDTIAQFAQQLINQKRPPAVVHRRRHI